MARPRLSKARNSAVKSVAQKIAGKAKNTATAVSGKATTIAKSVVDKKPTATSITMPSGSTSTTFSAIVPGLSTNITPDAIAGMLPKFNESEYAISDPLNPPETLPQATEAQFDKGMRVYEGTQRALKLTGEALDVTRERFTTIGKQAKAFGAGMKAATEFERVKGDFLDYQGQLQTNEQKGISLSVSQHKTTTDRTAAVHTTASMDEKLRQAEIAAELARANTQDKQKKLDEFKKSLGQYVV